MTLDLTPCSGQLQADTRDNPFLTTVYASARRSVDYNGPTGWSSADRPPASFSADCPRRFPSPARIASFRLLRCLLLPPALFAAFAAGFRYAYFFDTLLKSRRGELGISDNN
ncbi:MAG: hypothetical protein ACLT1W_15015 [Alistipes onderdonkii]